MLLFRITRELVLNAIKHASARRVDVSVESAPGLPRIHVRDDGVGFAVEDVINRSVHVGGFGLFSIRDRHRFLGRVWIATQVPKRVVESLSPCRTRLNRE